MAQPKIISVNLEPMQARILASLPASDDRKRIVRGLGAKAMHFWKRIAQERLLSTARDYVSALNFRMQGETAIIELLNVDAEGKPSSIPNMIEQGMSGFDLRETLLKGPNVKFDKKGQPYNTIPFRHGTPGTTGRNVGQPMPKAIHTVAMRLDATLSRPGTPVGEHGGQTTVWGERLHPGLTMRANARRILTTKKQPWHATSIYMGMIRKGKHIAGGKIQTTGFTTFRRISRHSSGEKHWMHPGVKARHFAKDVTAHIAAEAHAIVVRATR